MGTAVLQRKCGCQHKTSGEGECEECRKKKEAALQRKPAGGLHTSTAPAVVHDVLRGSGEALDPSVRNYMEPRFTYDFSKVRVHKDEQAARSADAVNAQAYTVGENMVFGKGQYHPDSVQGRQLLAHELTHVVQQAGATIPSGNLQIGPENDNNEKMASASER